MDNIFALTVILLKNSISAFGTGKASSLKNKIFFILITLSFLPFVTGIVRLTKILFTSLSGNTSIILTLSSSVYCLLILFFAVFFVISIFYFSQDIEFLLPLPFKPYEILAAKYFVVLLYEYLTGLIFFAPIVITFGFMAGYGVIYYLYLIIVFLTLPVIPLVAASLITIFIMSFISISKNKDLFRIIAGILAIVCGVGFSAYIQTGFKNMNDSQMIQTILTHNNYRLINYFSNMFPSVKYSTYALFFNYNAEGLFNLFIFVALNIVTFIFFILAGEKLYLKGALNSGISSSSKSHTGKVAFASKDKSILSSLINREIITLFRTPSYFMNCILINFIWPILIFLFILQNGSNIEKQVDFIKAAASNIVYVFYGIALGILLGSSNVIASTAFSREGKDYFYLKLLPLQAKSIVLSKIITSFSLSLIGLILIIIMAICYNIIGFTSALIIVLFSFIGILYSCFSGVIIDLFSPKLLWDNEYKAVKQNLNSIISMVLQFATIAGLIYLVQNKFFNYTFLSSTVLFLFLIITGMMYLFLSKKSGYYFNRIE
ncbi:MAG: hypothetical protein Q8903_01515 [Bacteroidota bacterium]|nr:hypothetical protein [Bacteroidota bacterium]